jgi:colanic acid/amylovoran biosynthesis glycosyltransferase
VETSAPIRSTIPPEATPGSIRMAYLLSRYPAISHTFFLHEVLGLRARGLHIETASINAPDRPLDALPAVEATEARATFYLKGKPPLSAAFTLLTILLTAPAAVFRGLSAVFAVSGLTLRQRAFWLFYLAEALLLGRWMQQRNLPHLHVHFGGAVASVGMLTSAAWRIPYSLTIHGPEELLNADSYQLRAKLDHAAFVFCISDFCRSQLLQLTPPAHWPRFQVIRLGVDPVLLGPQSRTTTSGIRYPGKPRPIEIVCTGRLVPAKGHRILLEALRLLRDRGTLTDIPVHLTLIGAGPEQPSLQHFVAHHALADAVTFTSALSHPQTLAHLRRADLFVLASFAEGIPVAIMEAMALGIPCISTTIAGIPELIHSGVDGILVPPANAPALADALETLLTDPTLRKNLGNSARQRIITQYNLPLNQELLAHSFEAHLNPGPQTMQPRESKEQAR